MSEPSDLSMVVGGLKEAVENLTRTWAEQDRKATDGRRELYGQVTQLRIDLAKMQPGHDSIAELVERVDRLEASHDKALGAAWLARLGLATFAGIIGALLTKFGPWK